MDRFMRGLEKYSISKAEIDRGDWVYSGGNQGRHLRYWKLRTKGEEIPDLDDHCVCGHYIKENCYIENSKDPNDIIVLGNCCIKRFLPKEASGRTCEKCRRPHRNRKDNLCNACRKLGFCKSCQTPVKQGRTGAFFLRCYPCSRNHRLSKERMLCPQRVN